MHSESTVLSYFCRNLEKFEIKCLTELYQASRYPDVVDDGNQILFITGQHIPVVSVQCYVSVLNVTRGHQHHENRSESGL